MSSETQLSSASAKNQKKTCRIPCSDGCIGQGRGYHKFFEFSMISELLNVCQAPRRGPLEASANLTQSTCHRHVCNALVSSLFHRHQFVSAGHPQRASEYITFFRYFQIWNGKLHSYNMLEINKLYVNPCGAKLFGTAIA